MRKLLKQSFGHREDTAQNSARAWRWRIVAGENGRDRMETDPPEGSDRSASCTVAGLTTSARALRPRQPSSFGPPRLSAASTRFPAATEDRRGACNVHAPQRKMQRPRTATNSRSAGRAAETVSAGSAASPAENGAPPARAAEAFMQPLSEQRQIPAAAAAAAVRGAGAGAVS